jgi:hypothetical protein
MQDEQIADELFDRYKLYFPWVISVYEFNKSKYDFIRAFAFKIILPLAQNNKTIAGKALPFLTSPFPEIRKEAVLLVRNFEPQYIQCIQGNDEDFKALCKAGFPLIFEINEGACVLKVEPKLSGLNEVKKRFT